MPLTHLFILLLLYLYYFWGGKGLARMFQVAGGTAKTAAFPFLNTWWVRKRTKSSYFWVVAQLIPIVGLFATINLWMNFARLFNKQSIRINLLLVTCPFLAFHYIAQDKKLRIYTEEELKKYPKHWLREWIDALVFALIAAHLVRTFFIEIYVIPTPSMEKTIMVNDFVLVNKSSYGVRLPETPLTFPLTHNVLPSFLNFSSAPARSFLTFPHIPYTKWFAKEVKRGDVVVFNFPVNDTFINKEGYQSAVTYYEVCRQYGKDFVQQHPKEFPLATRPVDKREHFVKRCVAVAGDTFSLLRSVVHINGKPMDYTKNTQKDYLVETSQALSYAYLTDSLKLTPEHIQAPPNKTQSNASSKYYLLMTDTQVQQLSHHPHLINIYLLGMGTAPSAIYPHNDSATLHYTKKVWTDLEFGPLWIPKKGASIPLNEWNYMLYERLIRVYEHNTLEVKDGHYYVNGQVADSYTFKMNYYFMMGDNRANSLDSRFWGLVPEDHIVAEAGWTIFSKTPNTPLFRNIRWERMFHKVQ